MPTKEWRKKNKKQILKYQRDWYAKNKKTEIVRVLKRKNSMREWLFNLKLTLKCEQCGMAHPGCLEFHHLDAAAKSFAISAGISNGKSKETILAEMKKCRVLCSNCHKIEHYNQL